ncbi:MAG: transaldolase [Clostridia bacterium]|nr:transaldolase [Clostridia bacterium]
MEFFVDSADLETVKAIAAVYPIDGFTTNPNILTQASRPLDGVFAAYRDYLRETGCRLFVQVTAKDAEGMTEQGLRLRAYFGDNLVVKLPATGEGYRALKVLKARGLAVCVTVIHSVMQALVAARAGADYAAPYISHIDNIGADGIRCAAEMVSAFARYGCPCKLLGASFRTVDQIERLAAVGCHAVTVAPAMFPMLIAHPSTDVSLAGFDAAWRGAFGDREVTDFLP